MRPCRRNTILPESQAAFGLNIMRVSTSKRLLPYAMHAFQGPSD